MMPRGLAAAIPATMPLTAIINMIYPQRGLYLRISVEVIMREPDPEKSTS
jgi:hypothetical protein